MTDPACLYALMCEYVTENGWQREEPGSGWWWHPTHGSDDILGGAVEEQLRVDGIDTREEPDIAAPAPLHEGKT